MLRLLLFGLIVILIAPWRCNCEVKLKSDELPEATTSHTEQGKTVRLQHYGHFGRLIASPSSSTIGTSGRTSVSEEVDDEGQDQYQHQDQDRDSGHEMYREFTFRRPEKGRKRFWQAMQYIPRRRLDPHSLDSSDYHSSYYYYPYPQYSQQQFQRRGYEEFHLLNGHHGGGMDRSDFYYVLPILLVIGLGAFLIPIITTFFTALVTSNTALCGRRKRNDHFVVDWKPLFQQKVLEMWSTVERAVQAGLQKYGNPGANEDEDDDERSSHQNRTISYHNRNIKMR